MSRPLTLLVLSPSTGGYYFGALLSGMTREVAAAGGRVVLVQTLEPGLRSDQIGEPPDFSLPVSLDQIDGVVSVTSAVRADYLERLQQAGVPVVVASNRLDGLSAPTAVPDNHGGTVAAVEHLLTHGHTEVGFIGNLVQQDIRDRYDALCSTLAAHGLSLDPDHLYSIGDNGEGGGLEAAEAFLASSSRPTAIMAATDRNGLGFLRGTAVSGLRVPRDLALISFDNIEASAYSEPALTTVDQPFDEVGALAARLVLAQLRGQTVPPVPHTSPASVVVRGSCGCAAAPRPSLTPAGSDLAAAPAGPDVAPSLHAELRSGTIERLARPLRSGRPNADTPLRVLLEQLLDDVDAAAAGDADPALADKVTASLRRLAPTHGSLRMVTRVLNGYVTATATDAGLTAFRSVLWHLEAGSFLQESGTFEARLDEQFEVDAGLLDADGNDPEQITWLAGTHVAAGVFARWDGEPGVSPLTVKGVYDPDGRIVGTVDEHLAAEHFPPRQLVDLARPWERQICYVVPVRTRDHHWGLLAVVAEIETTSARETYHHWAALLAGALEEQSLQDAVQASEERYALVTRAAKDGLWEWDGGTGVYLSERCRELLGLRDEQVVDLATWEAHVHPDDLASLRESMEAAKSAPGTPVEVEYRVSLDDGRTQWVLSRSLGTGPTGGPVDRLVGSLSDIQTRKELEEQLRQGALYDAVTGLPNRRLFMDRLAAAVSQQIRRPGAGFAVIFLDLDGFKLVNDSLGHLAGDELLTTVAGRLRAELRSADTAARFGGDEFAVLLVDPVPDEVLVIVERIQERISQPVTLTGQEIAVTASVGVATSHTEYLSAEDVVRDADTAMYHAKATERGSASVFDPDMHLRATGRLKARSEIRAALAENQFVVHYQPIVALDGTGLRQFEALVRWQHPERGLLLPGAFLPAMEDNPTIVALGQWLIGEVCRQVAAWRAEYAGPVSVSVNLSHREFWSTELVATLTTALAAHAVPPECLVLEITESVIMADPSAARDLMTTLHAMGLKLHVDDFGTGHSSLNALRTLPVDALKIDGSFIAELVQTERTRELVEVILYMGAVLGLDVIAECVETVEQAEQLQTMGCANAQGWLYARALPGDEAQEVLGTSMAVPLARPEIIEVGGRERSLSAR
ncbi:MAG TPA: EAL domain-containing protein [Actinotalea sp.]